MDKIRHEKRSCFHQNNTHARQSSYCWDPNGGEIEEMFFSCEQWYSLRKLQSFTGQTAPCKLKPSSVCTLQVQSLSAIAQKSWRIRLSIFCYILHPPSFLFLLLVMLISASALLVVHMISDSLPSLFSLTVLVYLSPFLTLSLVKHLKNRKNITLAKERPEIDLQHPR